MHRSRAWRGLAVAVAAGIIASAGPVTLDASARPARVHYPRRWGPTVEQRWGFTPTFPAGERRTRVREGVQPWNNLNEPQQWTEGAAVAETFDPMTECPAVAGTNGVFHRFIDGMPGVGDFLALTLPCQRSEDQRLLFSSSIVFDSGQTDFYTGPATPLPGEEDYLSTATHEWGHMTGFFGPADPHFDPNDASVCPDGATQLVHTMCPTIVRGSIQQRTLEVEDRQTFIEAYHQGYWLASSDGQVAAFGRAGFYGDRRGQPLAAPIVGMDTRPDATGYWLAASDGGVFNYGSASYYGSAGDVALKSPIVGMATTPTGNGYWLVAADGGIFTYGGATFHGSTGALQLRAPIVGMAATPSGGGYWLVASDGGVFAFGDAPFRGSLGATTVRHPIVGMIATPSGGGYLLAASDGSVFTFGDAIFFGSAAGGLATNPVSGIAAIRTTTRDLNGAQGYRLFDRRARVYPFGPDTAYYGYPRNVQVTVVAGSARG